MKRIINCVIILLVFGGCNQGADKYQNEPVGVSGKEDCFIDHFYDAKSLSWVYDGLSLNDSQVFLCVKVNGEICSSYKTGMLRESLGDSGREYPYRTEPSRALFNRFQRVEVTSSCLFNGMQPGESLGKIVSLYGATAYPEIINKVGGYKSQKLDGYIKNAPPFWMQNQDFFWYHKKLDELNKEDLFLLDPTLLLCFDEMPEEKGQTLTITLTDDAGKELSITGTFTFPE